MSKSLLIIIKHYFFVLAIKLYILLSLKVKYMKNVSTIIKSFQSKHFRSGQRKLVYVFSRLKTEQNYQLFARIANQLKIFRTIVRRQ